MANQSAAELLAVRLYPWSAADIREIAAAYLADPAHADFTDLDLHEHTRAADLSDAELEQLEQDVHRLRFEHFRRLGQEPPPQPSPIE
jgi:ActR/RegA family two-component response regulator